MAIIKFFLLERNVADVFANGNFALPRVFDPLTVNDEVLECHPLDWMAGAAANKRACRAVVSDVLEMDVLDPAPQSGGGPKVSKVQADQIAAGLANMFHADIVKIH